MRALFAAACLLLALPLLAACGGGKKAPPTPTATQPPVSATATASPSPAAAVPACPPRVDLAVCAFAVQVEGWVALDDAAKIAAGSSWDNPGTIAAVRGSFDNILPQTYGRERKLIAIGCPFGAVDWSCDTSFALAFTTLDYGVMPRTGDRMLILGFDRTPGASPKLALLKEPRQYESMRAAARGDLAQEMGLACANPDNCPRTIFFAYWTGPYEPSAGNQVDGLTFKDLTIGDSIPVPQQGALLIETGCWGCEGPATGLDRIWRDASGTVHRDKLLAGRGTLTGIAVAPGGMEIVAGVCATGECGLFAGPSADAATLLLRSRDGGVTWQREATLAGSTYPAFFLGDQVVLNRFSGEGSPDSWSWSYELYPSGERLAPPAGAAGHWLINAGGESWWRDEDGQRWLRADGSVAFDPHLGSEPEYGTFITVAPGGETVVDQWQRGPAALRYGVFQQGKVIAAFEASHGIGLYLGPWLDATHIFGNTQIPGDDAPFPDGPSPRFGYNQPVLIDLASGVIHPIEPDLFKGSFGRELVVGYIPGPLVRVNTPGDCLNIREMPAPGAPILTCAADNVLLQDTGVLALLEGNISRLGVKTPDGRPGWASEDYLVR